MMPKPHKLDAYTRLEPLRPEFAHAIFTEVERNRKYLRQWLPWVDATDKVSVTRAFIRGASERNKKGESQVLTIWHRSVFAGMASLHDINRSNRKALVGYWLAERFQGKGLVTRTVAVLLDIGFKKLKLNRIELRAAVDNVKSRAIAKRLGFKYEGRMRESERLCGQFVDHAVYSMLAREWRSKSSARKRSKGR